ncbi:glycosyltransferase family 2 protein [Candidatus Uabimicrobium amorphum]|uniref:Dolichol-phosphate mannosyltransferase n=1 Tax=Uabimicrobium amorphum TaxID=2596890 RepID=A0A5S9F6P5_UABAM|nr:glycosyltransferase family 2 protein [Candidatus Uabimicrobium amorphum]BBM87423.1 dolichol-phosphate mannosyltransferase [Candidatus Uabimicrobium amorphum]
MYSIVIPVYNEIESIERLFNEIIAVVEKLQVNYEIIFLDDGSRDGSYEKLCEMKDKNSEIRVVSFARNYGKSVIYSTGFELAKGEYIITMDSDLQDDPNEIPRFIEKIKDGYDVVVGWKKNRFQNEPLKKIPSLCYNFLKQFFFGIRLRDSNCGFRILRKEAVRNLNLYGDRYRFIPELSHISGFRVCEIPINHRKRTYGHSKYGFFRFFTGFFDILSVRFLSSYHFKPLHFFGTISLIPITIGFILECYVMWQKIWNGSPFQKHVAAIIIGVMMIMVGVQFLMTGFLGEMLSYQKKTPHINYNEM